MLAMGLDSSISSFTAGFFAHDERSERILIFSPINCLPHSNSIRQIFYALTVFEPARVLASFWFSLNSKFDSADVMSHISYPRFVAVTFNGIGTETVSQTSNATIICPKFKVARHTSFHFLMLKFHHKFGTCLNQYLIQVDLL